MFVFEVPCCVGHFCYCSLLIFYGDIAMMPCVGISSMHSEVKGKSPYQFQVLISSCLAFWISLSIFFASLCYLEIFTTSYVTSTYIYYFYIFLYLHKCLGAMRREYPGMQNVTKC